MSTYHFKVLSAALVPAVVAGEQHVLDVVARSIVELTHVERSWFEGQEIRLDLQGLQNTLLYHVSVSNLISEGKRRQIIAYCVRLCAAQKLQKGFFCAVVFGYSPRNVLTLVRDK